LVIVASLVVLVRIVFPGRPIGQENVPWETKLSSYASPRT